MKPNASLALFIAVLLLLATGLTACERSLSPSGGITPGAQENNPSQAPSDESNDVMSQIWKFATQTAMAQAIQPGQATPLPPLEQGTAPAVENTQPAAPQPEATQPPAVQPTLPPLPTATLPPVIVPTATPGIPTTYTVHSGDFVYCLARRFNVNPTELLAANGLGVTSQLSPGQTLNIPQTGNPFPGERMLRAHPTTHTVATGETIYSIACLYGDVSPDAIAYANNLSEPYNVAAGQTLQIP